MGTAESVSETSMNLVKATVLRWFGDDDVVVVLFGSRAGARHHRHSDIDIGVLPGGEFDRSRLSALRELLGTLNIPYEVELVDLTSTSASMRDKALAEGVVWKS